MGIRFILLILAILAIWLILRVTFKAKAKRIKETPKAKLKSAKMIACERCGLHVPEQEAVERDGHFYCSEAHAKPEDENR